MERQPFDFKRVPVFTILLSAMAISPLAPPRAAAQDRYVVKPVAEMKVKQLPRGPLYWRVENFPTLAQATAAAGSFRWNPNTVSYDGSPSLAAEVAGKAWLFTLGAKDGATPGGSKVAEIGPVPPITASEFLLRVNHGSGPPGSRTPMHSHPKPSMSSRADWARRPLTACATSKLVTP